jgi:hypothetical protein
MAQKRQTGDAMQAKWLAMEAARLAESAAKTLAAADEDRDNEERVETLEWVDGWFDPEEFDAATATKSMWKGLPDWRSMELN